MRCKPLVTTVYTYMLLLHNIAVSSLRRPLSCSWGGGGGGGGGLQADPRAIACSRDRLSTRLNRGPVWTSQTWRIIKRICQSRGTCSRAGGFVRIPQHTGLLRISLAAKNLYIIIHPIKLCSWVSTDHHPQTVGSQLSTSFAPSMPSSPHSGIVVQSADPRFGTETGPIFLDQLNCAGTELRLVECPSRQPLGLYTCSADHSNDVAIRCQGACAYLSVYRFEANLMMLQIQP